METHMPIMQQQSHNPTLRSGLISQFPATPAGQTMTLHGALNKVLISLVLVVVSALYTWNQYVTVLNQTQNPAHAMAATSMYLWIGLIAGLILAIATAFKPMWAAVTAPLYAIAEGLFLGSMSAMFNASYPGIVIQAISLTFAVMAVMWFLYQSGLIRVTNKLRMGIMAATGGVFLFYLVTWIVGFFGVSTENLFFGSQISIVISLVIVAIAAFNLLLDFDLIARGAQSGWPHYMEWYSAFALTVTLVWLYLELLTLLANLNSR
ncbi:membrane protein containing DUF1112 [mine drainage metagenome]|uniref:Membrane protein containing DUF1112 n=2 Tax=mine drainage metagenome TaxID=410659 RepID=T0Y5T1_9ZZZZ